MNDQGPDRVLGSVRIRVRVTRPPEPLPGGRSARVKGVTGPISSFAVVTVVVTAGLLLVVGVISVFNQLVNRPRATAGSVATQQPVVSAMPTTSEPTSTPRHSPTPRPPTETPTSTPTPVRLPSPQTGVDITIVYDPSAGPNGQILLQLAAGGQGLDLYRPLQPAAKDFTGQWRWEKSYSGNIFSNGSEEIFNREDTAGDYAILFGTYWEFSMGLDTVFVPKKPNHSTLVNVSLGILEVGVLSATGTALQDRTVWVSRQGVDAAGRPVSIMEPVTGNYAFWERTDVRGIAEFPLAEGTYVITIFRPGLGPHWRFYNVQVQEGQRDRAIFTVEE